MVKPEDAMYYFSQAARKAANAFQEMSFYYEFLDEEQRHRVDGLYLQNLKSMDEQAHDLSEFAEDFDA